MLEIAVGTRERLIEVFTRRFERDSAEAIAARGRFTMAIAGGSVAQAFLPALATANVPWPQVEVFWCDERAVPDADPHSNFGAAVDLLFARPPAREAMLHGMGADTPDLDRAADDYEAQMRHVFGAEPQLDLILIGAGEDGHVCSLFPGHAALGERERWVVAVRDAPKPPPERLTLTLPVLHAARHLYLGAFGSSKAAMARDVIEDRSSQLPAALALRGPADVMCLLDHEAAGLLSRA